MFYTFNEIMEKNIFYIVNRGFDVDKDTRPASKFDLLKGSFWLKKVRD